MKNTRKLISILLAVVMLMSVMSLSAVSSSAYSSYTAHYSEDGLWLYRVGTSGTASLDCYLGTDGDIVVPATVDGYKVSGIWNGTFDGEDGSGRQTPVRVTISEGITTIETGTFRSCANLKEVILPDSITYIGSDAFLYSGIYNDESNWEDGLLYIGKYLVAEHPKFVERSRIVKEVVATRAREVDIHSWEDTLVG